MPIAARDQAPERPSSGWCGETAIQEGLLHLGVWAPQAAINRAGHPRHADLYSGEMPVALAAFGVELARFDAARRGFAGFAAWSRQALDAGDAVIGGVKIFPTEHPEWDLDHFVTVVGYGARGLLVNTTWGYREWVADGGTGLSFRNAAWGLRLRGLKLPAQTVRARLTVLSEDAERVTVRVACDGLTAGADYRLERRAGPAERDPAWSADFHADGARFARELALDATQPAYFACAPFTPAPAPR